MKLFLFHFSSLIAGVLVFAYISLASSIKSLRLDSKDNIVATTRDGSSFISGTEKEGLINYTSGGSDVYTGNWYQVGKMVFVSLDIAVTATATNYNVSFAALGLPNPKYDFKLRTGSINAGSLNFPVAQVATSGTNIVFARRLDNGSSAAVDISSNANFDFITFTYLTDN